MAKPVLITDSGALRQRPILIIDKRGTLGVSIAKKTTTGLLTVLVTGYPVDPFPHLVHVPYKKQIPIIPDNNFSHIIVVYNGEPEILEMLEVLAKKAASSRGKLVVIMGVRAGSEKLYRRLFSKYSPLSLLLVGDVFGGDLWEYNLVNDFLYQVKTYGKIVIPNSGLYRTYPLSHDDAVGGIVEAIFIRHLAKRVYFVFPPHPVTALSLARLLEQAYPEVPIDFLKTKERTAKIVLPDEGEYVLPAGYPLGKKLKETTLISKKPVRFRAKKRPKESRRVLLFSLLGIALFVLMPFLTIGFFSGTGLVLLSFGKGEFDNGKYQESQQLLTGAKNAFHIAGETGDTAEAFAGFVGLGNLTDTLLAKVDVGEQVADATSQMVHAYQLLLGIGEGKSVTPKADFVSAINEAKGAAVLVQELMKNDATPTSLKRTLARFSPEMQLFSATSELYPEILGFNGKKRYLVLLQNNMELRPGGGFIGSYALVPVENGKVGKVSIQNVYDADGKLTGHIEPPFPLRRYMGIQHLFLRDSNFGIDFPSNAAQAAYFLKLETGESVDGVIAIDTDVLRSLLGVTGPITLPNFNETLTAENFYLLTEQHAQDKSFPGSRQKQDFLNAAFAAIQQKLTEKGNRLQLLQNLVKSLTEKHIMIAFPDKSVEAALTVTNMAGALYDPRKETPDAVNDFFGVNEANLSENKSNYYLHRTFSHNLAIAHDGTITHAATITYANTAKNGDPFAGDYKTYIRLLLPNDATITSLAIDGSVQDLVPAVTESLRYERTSFVPPTGLETMTDTVNAKKSLGFYLIVPKSTTKKVTVNYQLPAAIKQDPFTYSLLFFKQPGTEDDPYVVTLHTAEGIHPEEIDPKLQGKKGIFTTFGPLATDISFRTKFQGVTP